VTDITSFDFTPYHYRAEVVSVYDADTITVSVDLGFKIKVEQVLRFSRIDAWEVQGPERPRGIVARDWLRGVLTEGTKIFVQTIKDKQGKYGRYIAEIFVESPKHPEGSGELFFRNLNDELVSLGHAEYKDY